MSATDTKLLLKTLLKKMLLVNITQQQRLINIYCNTADAVGNSPRVASEISSQRNLR